MDPVDRSFLSSRSAHSKTRRDYSGENQYSSSDGEENASNCLNRAGLTRVGNAQSYGNQKHWTPEARKALDPSCFGHMAGEKCQTGADGQGTNTMNRLYSYLSGSDGEGDAHQSSAAAGRTWETRRKSQASSCSSISTNGCSSPTDSAADPEDIATGSQNGQATDTLDSSGIGENVYSRIKDSSLLGIPVIPPPPLTESVPGPAVPPRRNHKVKVMNNSSTQTLERRPRRSAHYADQPSQMVDPNFEPHFLMHTASGNLLIPSGQDEAVSVALGTPVVPTFPRTVPRTISLSRDAQNRQSITDSAFVPVRQNVLPAPATDPTPNVTNCHGLNSATGPTRGFEDARIAAAAERHNVTFNPNATLVPTLPTYPSVHNDFRDYTQFNSASYQVKKHLVCNGMTWKCVSLVLLCVIVILTAVVAYLLAMKFYSLSWHHDADIYLTDTYYPNTSHGTSRREPSLVNTQSVVVKQYHFGHILDSDIAPYDFLRISFFLSTGLSIKFNLSVPRGSFVGVYGRKSAYPTHAQYDFFSIVDGEKLVATSTEHRQERSTEHRKAASYKTKDSVFVRFLQPGIWYVFFYNDGSRSQHMTFVITKQDGASDQCSFGCHGKGECIGDSCQCFPGYAGPSCNDEVCPVLCTGNGIYKAGVCKCYRGWAGSECQLSSTDCPDPSCSGHGKCVDGQCICSPGFSGPDCNTEVCEGECIHGRCEQQRCQCQPGWSGTRCDLVGCDPRCETHGFCNNGTCVCQPGWNGRHCTIDGCPQNCNNHGSCQLFHVDWMCNCRDGWKGFACNVAMELDCADNADEDRDGLIDCQDPDCCMSISCRDSPQCNTAPDPMEILLRKQPYSISATFYDRMRFLIEDDSVQSFATLNSFNQTQVSVIRGKVVTSDGSPMIGVRVTVVTQPLYGFTLTREQGLFDMLVNGGGSVTLSFMRQPFQTKKVTVMVPWNRMVSIDDVILTLNDQDEQMRNETCPGVNHNYYRMKPMVISTWQVTQLGMCPSKTAVILESQVLQESLQIPGTDIHLVHHSSETYGYMSTIMVLLTGTWIPSNLITVRLRILVEGLVYEKIFEADRELKYRFAWDRRNAYNQKVYGLVKATVQVGYQYSECKRIFWEIQSATMNSYDMRSSDMSSSYIGGWNLNIHHTYNAQEGIVYKGDGTNIYLKEQPRRVVAVLGNGHQQKIDCRACDGKAEDNRLIAPVALASGRDGSLYIGDYNYIRKLSAARDEVASILQLSTLEFVYKYFMTVNPVDGRLYISDHKRLRIIRVKTMGPVRDLSQNYETIAGTGEQCIPGDREKCGDGGSALMAKLFYPKGIAMSKDGLIYIADGANIRTIDEAGFIRTIIGSQEPPRHWIPMPCFQSVDASEVTLQWPTAIAVNPIDDTLYILDNNVILKLTHDRKILVVAGRQSHCPPRNISESEGGSAAAAAVGSQLAIDTLLEHPQHISFAQDGNLFIVESHRKTVNQVRVMDMAGHIRHYAGANTSQCDCRPETCVCTSTKDDLAVNLVLDNPTTVAVTPDGVLHIADMGSLRIYSIVSSEPIPDRLGQVEVKDTLSQEVYVFNRYGQHIMTKSQLTDQLIYNFTYVSTLYGKLTKVSDGGGNILSIRRDYKSSIVKEIVTPSGSRAKLSMDVMDQLQVFIANDNVTTRFSYLGNTGLVESKETSDGQTFLYEYDDFGRLSTVILPTGERLSFDTDMDSNGVRITYLDQGDGKVTMSTNGNHLSRIQDNIQMTISRPNDGHLVSSYPSGSKIMLERSSSLLRSSEHQTYQKYGLQSSNNRTYSAEWSYSTHSDAAVLHSALSQVSRKLKIGSDNILMFEYDRNSNTEMVYNQNQERILTAIYDRSGRPVHVAPVGPVESLNITYDQHGRMTGWNRGELSVMNVFDDRTSDMVERKLANRIFYRYIYKNGNKPTDVILPSGKQYQIHYDDFGNLKAITMPNLSRHFFHSLVSLGFVRQLYRPPGSHGVYVRDYNGAGQLLHFRYPSNHRRATFYHSNNGNRVTVFADWTNSMFDYHPITHKLLSAVLMDASQTGYWCGLKFTVYDAMTVDQSISFGQSNLKLVNASFHYVYDEHARLASREAVIGGKTLKRLQLGYSSDNGRLISLQTFVFEYPRIHREVTRDPNVEITREFDRYNRMTDVWYRFNTYVVFNLEIKYDTLNRIHQWRRKIGSSDLKAYEYLYDIDGNVIEVLGSGQSTWKYEMDTNNNIVKVSYYGNIRNIVINQRDQVEISGQESYVYDQDGFLAQHNRETYEYDSFGRLLRAFETGRYDIQYFYDARRQIIARKDVTSGHVVQFFYGDVRLPERLTHTYDQQLKRVTEYFYDNSGRLFAMKTESDIFYIALDPNNSPILILNSVGSVVKQIEYDPLGSEISDSAPQVVFHLGFQCAIYDRTTKLLFLGSRVYDPQIGRWTTPNYADFLDSLGQIVLFPEMSNIYQNSFLWRRRSELDDIKTDFSSWLNELGYDMASLLPGATPSDCQVLRSSISCSSGRSLISIATAFDCAFSCTLAKFLQLSAVPRSQIVMQNRHHADQQQHVSMSLLTPVFGRGVILSVKDGRVTVSVLESANERLALIATTLLNNSDSVGLHFTIHGRDTHFFVKRQLEKAADDIKEASIQREAMVLGLDISVHTHHESPNVVKYIDIRLQRNHTALNLRYGTTVALERERVLHHALLRATEGAWVIERELLQSGKLTINSWSKTERGELLSKGNVAGMQPQYIRSVLEFPELADDPRNIRFVPLRN